MKKDELTRRKIFSLTSSHRFYANACWFFAILYAIGYLYAAQGKFHWGELLMGTVGLTISGFLCCLKYFIDILTMNIKNIEGERDKGSLIMLSHGKESVGYTIQINYEDGRSIRLKEYDKVFKYSEEMALVSPKYDYKRVYYYLSFSKVLVFTEHIPIGEAKKYNSKKRKKYYKIRDLNNN